MKSVRQSDVGSELEEESRARWRTETRQTCSVSHWHSTGESMSTFKWISSRGFRSILNCCSDTCYHFFWMLLHKHFCVVIQFECWKYLGIFSLSAGADQNCRRSGKSRINCNKEGDIFWEIYQAIINKNAVITISAEFHCILSSDLVLHKHTTLSVVPGITPWLLCLVTWAGL